MSKLHSGVLLCALGLLAGAWIVRAGPLDPPAGAVASSYRTLDQVLPTWDRVIPGSQRFQLVMGGEGVLDLETGLVWEQHPDTNFVTHNPAIVVALDKVVGGRKGWRLPSVEEFQTLIDMSQPVPHLPVGHPFTPPPSGFQSFWTGTKTPPDESRVYQVDMGLGQALSTTIFNQGQLWLVRGGTYSQARP